MLSWNSMKRFRFLSLTLAFSLVSVTATCQDQTRRPSRYLIPEGYVGWVRIDFNITDAPPLPLENGFYVFKFPESGRIQTSSDMEYGVAHDEYYYYADKDRKALQRSGWGGGGLIWGGFNGGAQGAKEVHEYFFVGTEAQLKEFGWKEKDEEHLYPKVGPILPLPASNKRLQPTPR
jgi:hypothetical protein